MTAVPSWNIVGPSGSDADLVRACLTGDRAAFAEIYDRYADRLHDFCVGMLRDRDGAADCVQDAFCVAASRLPQLREPDKLRPWLYSIARNEALRRLRERRRETPSEELPEEVSPEAGPETLAARTELANLIAEAAGGLSDRDQAVLELAYRQGLDGPELAEALGVSQTTANTLMHRLRQTIERSLGALLVSRRARSHPDGCPGLLAVLDGWDGHFTILMRKRIARHVESCPMCDEQRHRLVSPAALLGAAPALIPAPAWLRERTLRDIQLVCHSTALGGESDTSDPTLQGASESVGTSHRDASERRRSRGLLFWAALVLAVMGASLGLTFAWLNREHVFFLTPTDLSETSPEPAGVTPSNVPLKPDTAVVQTPSVTTPVLTPSHTPSVQSATPMPEPSSPPVNDTPADEPTPEVIPRISPTGSSSVPTPSVPKLTPTSRARPTPTGVSPKRPSSQAPRRPADNPAPRQQDPAPHR
jgi:RNA polymerase sigma factor (sigma-70 family)